MLLLVYSRRYCSSDTWLQGSQVESSKPNTISYSAQLNSVLASDDFRGLLGQSQERIHCLMNSSYNGFGADQVQEMIDIYSP